MSHDAQHTPDAPLSDDSQAPGGGGQSRLMQLVTWAIALGCFYLVYQKIAEAGARENMSGLEYLVAFFASANWLAWLALMVPYSCFFFLVDAHVTWRVIRWFNAPEIRYRDILPIRGSAYILSLVNEQVGKGAMGLYLYRRYNVAGWEVASSMILLAVAEVYQLFFFSGLGIIREYELVKRASTLLPLHQILPGVYFAALLYLPIHFLYFSGRILPNSSLRERRVLHALRELTPRQLLLIVLFKAPNLLGAVAVYTLSLRLFQVHIGFGQMLAFLPVIFLAAALPLPFHAGALLLWTVLFPDFPEVGAFSLVMHTFFVTFNAVIGLAFLPTANRELFGDDPAAESG